MNKIVGIQFKRRGKVYDFGCGHFVLSKGDRVIVVTEEGPAVGCVVTEPQEVEIKPVKRPLKNVYRLATEEEMGRYDNAVRFESEVYDFCYERIKARKVPMCLVSVDRRFDGSKTVIFFTAEGRVDFRDLVKDLVRRFRTRIEMRQIGVRHQAKMVGGLGPCGRPLCCSTFLENFDPVTIKMAKEQNISLNPGKISGMCGRLMCCLAYEHGFYEQIKKNFPKMNKKVNTPRGQGKVIRHNVLKETVTVLLEPGVEAEFNASEVKICAPEARSKKERSKK
ncbi:MAG TPA: stage 0 sporulation protein [Desulfobacteraceae bacterium]|nr:stage 0 sporulation protein [Desulfobacteraceae bacterium]